MRSKEIFGLAIGVAFIALAWIGCSSSDEVDFIYPEMETELVDAYIGSDSLVKSIVMDDDTRIEVEQPIKASKGDTIYRCLASFARGVDGSPYSTTFYTISSVPSNRPVSTDSIRSKLMNHDARDLTEISRWETSRYVNALVSFKTTTDDGHSLVFVEDSVGEDSTVYVSLVHIRPEGDSEGYTKRVYVSLPRVADMALSIEPGYE